MSRAYTPGTVPTAPYGWNQQTSVPPASPYTPQPECKLSLNESFFVYNVYYTPIIYFIFRRQSSIRTYYHRCTSWAT